MTPVALSLARTASRTAAQPRLAAMTTLSRSRGPVGIPPGMPFKETGTSTMHDNDPEVLEREKRRNLTGKTFGKMPESHDFAPGWNETLASASEANVKADKATGTPTEMQRKTVEHMNMNFHNDPENPRGHETAATDEAPFTEKDEEHMTPSESDVKADRNEFKWSTT